MTTYSNLEAWAVAQGYDPREDYAADVVLPDGYLSPHFRAAEFTCNHCGAASPSGIPQELLDILEDVRSHFDEPVNINSGYRCKVHNSNVGGARKSQHLYGTAADIWLRNTPPNDVYAYLDHQHEGGLGLYRSFTHVDVRGYRVRWKG